MKFSRPIILIIFLFGFVTLAACSANQAATPTPGALPSSTQTPKPTRTPSPSPTSTPTLTPLPTVAWTITAVEIQAWPTAANAASYVSWEDNSSIHLFGQYSVDALSGKTTALNISDYEASFLSPSSKSENYEIECRDQGQEMYYLPDRQLLSTAKIHIDACYTVRWAKDESAASIVSDDGDVYVWRTDGTAPIRVGQALPYSGASWSPDSSQLLTVDTIGDIPTGDVPVVTFNIAYPDGKPMRITGATLEAGIHWEPHNVRWLTNDIVENFEQCGNSGACLWFSYHDAITGKYLIGYNLGNYFSDPGHVARVSPDERWFAMSTSLTVANGEVYDSANKLMVMYDLMYHQKRVWATSDYSFAFSGWASDSRAFYFVRYPLAGQKPGTLLGLIALDPVTLKTKVVIPNVLLANENPDHNSVFVITAAKIETQLAADKFQAPSFQVDRLQAAVYTLDGKRTMPLQAVADSLSFEGRLAFEAPAAAIVPSEWSHKSNQVVFADDSGNLWLFNSEGKSTRLASSLPTEEWLEETAFKWSPDDRRLLVYRAHRAWVVTIN